MSENISPRLSLLLADATSEAKRLGNPTVTPLHLLEALRRAQKEQVETLLGAELLARADGHLAVLPRGLDRPTAGPEVVTLLQAVSPGLSPEGEVDELCAGLKSWLESLPDAELQDDTGTSAAGPDQSSEAPAADPPEAASADAGPAPEKVAAWELPEHMRSIAELVPPTEGLVGSTDCVDAVIAAVGAQRPALTVVVGAEGSGRTAVARQLATRIARPGYTGPLAGLAVVRVRAAAVMNQGRASGLLNLVRGVSQHAVVVLDDLEVLLGLGSGGTDYAMVLALRSLHENPSVRAVATLSSSFVDRLRSTDRELAEEVAFVDLPPLSPEDCAAALARAVPGLQAYHRVTIPNDVVQAALAPPTDRDTSVHPGLAVSRLDRAAATASARGGATVELADFRGSSTTAGAAVFDATHARDNLAAVIVGQDHALDRVVRRLRVTRSQLDLRPERPDGVFLFAGPTGTGKTATALALAKAVYGDPSAILRLDMSEYVEPHSVSHLVGSPPGYVGSTEPDGWLTTKIRRRPGVVLLLDEIEKAHPQVWNTFLQVFDSGRLTDRQGQVADFSRTVVVLTTNIGAGTFSDIGAAGFLERASDSHADEQSVVRAIKERMAPELVNRLDDVLVFHPLSEATVRAIAERQVQNVVERLRLRGYDVDVDPSVVDLLARVGFTREYGARPLQREIELRFVEPVVALGPGSYRAAVDAADELVLEPVAT